MSFLVHIFSEIMLRKKESISVNIAIIISLTFLEHIFHTSRNQKKLLRKIKCVFRCFAVKSFLWCKMWREEVGMLPYFRTVNRKQFDYYSMLDKATLSPGEKGATKVMVCWWWPWDSLVCLVRAKIMLLGHMFAINIQ